MQILGGISGQSGARGFMGRGCCIYLEFFLKAMGRFKASVGEFVTSIQEISLSRRCEQATAPIPSPNKKAAALSLLIATALLTIIHMRLLS